MSKFTVFLSVIAALIPVAATAKDPPEALDAQQLRTGAGAVRISVRSQLQYGGPLFVWFGSSNVGGAGAEVAFSVSRKQGAPFAGTNMIDSKPKIFALPPGHYRLVAHTAICEALPPPGTTCLSYGSATPTGRYDGQSVEFDVAAGKLTDAGEFILELPSTVDVGGAVSYKQAYKEMTKSSIRWRKIAIPVPAGFANLELTAPPSVPPVFVSAITCETKPAGSKGMSLFYPFKC